MTSTHPITGILILVLSTWALSTLDASGKWVMAAGLSLFFMVWVRYIVHLILVMTFVVPIKGWRIFKAKQPGMRSEERRVGKERRSRGAAVRAHREGRRHGGRVE